MIYKVMPSRSTRRRGFGQLVAYVLQDNKRGFVIQSENIASLRTASIEMDAVADSNFRAKRAAFHFTIAWGNDDRPTQRQMVECVKESIETLGLSGHQWLGVSHVDAGHDHIHVVANRVHPRTFRCAKDSFTYNRLQKLAAIQEIRYGWKISGRHVGKDVVIEGKTWDFNQLLPAKMSASARRSLAFEGRTSFQEWLAGEPRSLALRAVSKASATWRSFHVALARVGVRYERYRDGARVFDGDDDHFSGKAGHLGRFATLPKLEALLGAFEPAPSALVLNVDASYKTTVALAPPQRETAELRTAYQKDCARVKTEHATKLRRLLEEQRMSEEDRQSAMRLATEASIARVTASEPAIELQRLSIWAAGYALKRDLKELERTIKIERRLLRVESNALPRPPQWRPWLASAAKSGSTVAAAAIDKIRTRQSIPMSLPAHLIPTRRLNLRDMAMAEEVRARALMIEHKGLANLNLDTPVKTIHIPTPKIRELGL